MESVLVVGGAGYIGAHVVKEFLKSNYQVTRGEKKGVIMNKDLFEFEIASTEAPTSDEEALIYQPKHPESLEAIVEKISKETRRV